MRNRGVEIYIPGEHEAVCWDTLDLKTLLHTEGVAGDCVCDLLIEIHKSIKSAIWGGFLLNRLPISKYPNIVRITEVCVGCSRLSGLVRGLPPARRRPAVLPAAEGRGPAVSPAARLRRGLLTVPAHRRLSEGIHRLNSCICSIFLNADLAVLPFPVYLSRAVGVTALITR